MKLHDSNAAEYQANQLDTSLDEPIRLSDFNDAPIYPAQAAGEQGMLGALIENENADLKLMEQIKSDLQKIGESPVLQAQKQRAAERKNQGATNAAFQARADGKITQEQLESVLAMTPALTEDDIADMHREALMINLAWSQAKNPEDAVIAQQRMQELIARGYDINQAIQSRLDHAKSLLGDDIGQLSGGMAAELLPFATTIAFNKAFNTVFPDADLSFWQRSRGEIVQEFRDRMFALPENERYAVVNEFVEAMLADDSVLTGTAFQQLMMLEDALAQGRFEEGFAGLNWDRIIGNTISVLDFAAAGGVAKRLFDGTKSMFRADSPLSTLNTADQQKAAQLTAAAIKSDLSDAVKMTQAEVVEVTTVPAGYRKSMELMPPEMHAKYLERDEMSIRLLKDTEGNTLAVTPAEAREIRNAFRNEVKEVGNSSLIGNYTARHTDTGIEFTAAYGVRNSKGEVQTFRTAKEAMDQAKATFPDAKDIRILERGADNILKPVVFGKRGIEGSRRQGEFVFEVDGFKTFANTEAAANKLFIPDNTVIQSGPMAKWFFDPAARFAKWLSSGFAQSGDKSRAINAELQRIAGDFLKLSPKKKREVVVLLNKYAEDPASMDMATIAQLANHDEAVVNGFLAYRQAEDARYLLENRAFRNELTNQGAKHLVEGDFQNLGVPVSRSSARNTADEIGASFEVYDPIKGQMVRLSGKQVERLYDKGHSLYRVKDPVGDIARQTDYVMVTSPKQVRPVPTNPLNKIDGYIGRHYKEKYFIRQAVRGTRSGRKSTQYQYIRAVGDKSDANLIKQQYAREGKEVEIVKERGLAPSERATINLQEQIALGRMFWNPRAKFELKGVDGLARVADPVESMIKNMDSTAQYVGHQELLDTMKARWINTYGKNHENPVFPQERGEIMSGYNLADNQRAEALELWDHIRRAEGMMGKSSEVWRDQFMRFAEGIIGTSSRETMFGKIPVGKIRAGAARPFQFLAENSLNKMVRSIAFWHLIALNPIRQMYVQSMQFHFLWALAPKDAPKLWLNGQRLSFAWQTRKTAPKIYNARKDSWAKALGMSSKEYDDFVEGFEKTGIPNSVDSHDYVRNTMASYSAGVTGNIALRTARRAWNTVMSVPRTLKKVGFDQGELSNLASTFMLARRNYLKTTGKKQLKTRKDFETVAADARNYALDMTHSGAFAYQDGAFAALMQFFQIQHKAALAVLPFKKVGNQAFTKMERTRLMLGQFAVNGLTGLGLYELYKQAVEKTGAQVPEYADKFIVGGLHEMALNTALRLADDEAVDLNWAEGIAPLGGLNQDNIAENFIDVALGNRGLLESFAFMNVFNRYQQMAETMQFMYQFPELHSDDQYIDYISNFASMTSGWNQVLRAKAAMRLGVHVSNTGSPSVQAAWSSALAEGTLGISPRSREEFQAFQDEYTQRIMMQKELVDFTPETDEVARDLYRELTRTTTLFMDEFDPDLEADDTTGKLYLHHIQMMRDALKIKGSVMAMYDPIERDRIWQRFEDIARADKERGAKGLIHNLAKMMLRGDMGSSPEGLINRLRSSGLYNPDSPEGQQFEWNVEQIMKSLTATERWSEENMKFITREIDGKD